MPLAQLGSLPVASDTIDITSRFVAGALENFVGSGRLTK